MHMTQMCSLVTHLTGGWKVERHDGTAASEGGKSPIGLRLLLACGAIGPLLFIVVFLLEGATRADYNPLRYPVSSLSIGRLGWIQAANFLQVGILICAFALGVRRA